MVVSSAAPLQVCAEDTAHVYYHNCPFSPALGWGSRLTAELTSAEGKVWPAGLGWRALSAQVHSEEAAAAPPLRGELLRGGRHPPQRCRAERGARRSARALSPLTSTAEPRLGSPPCPPARPWRADFEDSTAPSVSGPTARLPPPRPGQVPSAAALLLPLLPVERLPLSPRSPGLSPHISRRSSLLISPWLTAVPDLSPATAATHGPRGGNAHPVPAAPLCWAGGPALAPRGPAASPRRAAAPSPRPNPSLPPSRSPARPQHWPARRPPPCPRLTPRSQGASIPALPQVALPAPAEPLGIPSLGHPPPSTATHPTPHPAPHGAPPPADPLLPPGTGPRSPGQDLPPAAGEGGGAPSPPAAPHGLGGATRDPSSRIPRPQHSPVERGQRAGGGGARPAQHSPLRSASERRGSRGGGGGGAARAWIMEGGLCPGPGLQDHPDRPGWRGEEEEEREGFNPGGIYWASGAGDEERLRAEGGLRGPSGSGWTRTPASGQRSVTCCSPGRLLPCARPTRSSAEAHPASPSQTWPCHLPWGLVRGQAGLLFPSRLFTPLAFEKKKPPLEGCPYFLMGLALPLGLLSMFLSVPEGQWFTGKMRSVFLNSLRNSNIRFQRLLCFPSALCRLLCVFDFYLQLWRIKVVPLLQY